MIKRFSKLVLVVTLLSVFFIGTTSFAKELLTNGGFETGDLTGWTPYATNSQMEDEGLTAFWDTSLDYASSGVFSAYTDWNFRLDQAIDPTPGSSIEKFQFAVRTSRLTYVCVFIFYTNGNHTWVPFIPTSTEWQTYDFTDRIDPNLEVSGIGLNGFEAGDPLTFYDDVTLQDNGPEPVIDDPIVDEPVIEDPVEDPVVEEPVINYPTTIEEMLDATSLGSSVEEFKMKQHTNNSNKRTLKLRMDYVELLNMEDLETLNDVKVTVVLEFGDQAYTLNGNVDLEYKSGRHHEELRNE